VTAEPVFEATAAGTSFHPALYLESALEPVESLRLVLGVRLDWYSEIEEWSFDPRIVAIQELGERTRIKLGAGLFSQPPSLQEAVPELGNPDLEPTQALHLGVGVAHELPQGFEVGADGFYKYLLRRVVSTPSGEPPFFSNDGTGRIYGLELYGRVPIARQIFGMLSYTLSRSERRDADRRWRAFDYDQTHVLVAAAGARLGAGWEVGIAFRLVSGNPYTPIVAGEQDLNHGVSLPIYAPLNSERNPLFHRLDARIEKTWNFTEWRLAFRIDVQNVYNATNREGEIYSWDFSRRTDLPGLPIIPSIGLRGEM
jgi:outer membrane receptor protein involved in Fe transport